MVSIEKSGGSWWKWFCKGSFNRNMDDLEGRGRRVKSDDSDKKMIDCDEYSLVQGSLIEILISFFFEEFLSNNLYKPIFNKGHYFQP